MRNIDFEGDIDTAGGNQFNHEAGAAFYLPSYLQHNFDGSALVNSLAEGSGNIRGIDIVKFNVNAENPSEDNGNVSIRNVVQVPICSANDLNQNFQILTLIMTKRGIDYAMSSTKMTALVLSLKFVKGMLIV